jgi:putative sigma-54 modulation protein
MNITIKSNKEKLTNELKSYTHKKLEKLTPHQDNITRAQIIYSSERLKKQAEAIINMPGTQLVSHAEGESLQAAMDKLIDIMLRQIVKHKETHREKFQ